MCLDDADFFTHPGAYPYPFGSDCMAWLEEATTDELRRLPLGRLRDQAVSLDEVFAEFRGRYLTLTHVREVQGLSPALETEWRRVGQALLRLRREQVRLRALLNETPQPRSPVRN